MQPRSTIAAAFVDLEGFEPSASSVRLKRAPNCATGPLASRVFYPGVFACVKQPDEGSTGGRILLFPFRFAESGPGRIPGVLPYYSDRFIGFASAAGALLQARRRRANNTQASSRMSVQYVALYQ
jgi:hypothetical protein